MKLKEIRSRIGLTQKQLADQMDTTQQTIARWETGKTVLNVDQIRDLCVVLGCTADELLGWGAEPGEKKTNPFSLVGSELPFGTLKVSMTCGERDYPVGHTARKSLLAQLEACNPINVSNQAAWLETWSLDNKLLLINPRYLRKLRLVTDDAEAMPDFENPEIYRALDDLRSSTTTGIARKKCDDLVDRMGGEEEVHRLIAEVRVTFDDGSDYWSYLSEEIATEWHGVSMAAKHLEQSCLVQIDEDGSYDSSFANLDHVAIVEIPVDRFLRLISDDDN